MSTDAHTLYQAAIMSHSRHPKNEGRLDTPTHEARVDNPLCGDRVTIQLRVTKGVIEEARFVARGCAIARASASILTESVAGRATDHAISTAEQFFSFAASGADSSNLGPLEPLRGVRMFPGRKRCATLPWEALKRALEIAGE